MNLLDSLSAAGLALATLALSAAPAFAAVQDNSTSTLVDANAGLCMGVAGSNNASGSLIQAQGCSGSPYQTWKFVADSAGYFQVINAGSGMCLDVPGASKATGTNLQQWGCAGSDNQKWNLSDQGNGQVALISKATGLAAERITALLRRRGVRIAGGLLVILFGLWTLPGPHQDWLMGHGGQHQQHAPAR